MTSLFKSVNNWAKNIGKKRVSSREIAFSSRVRHFNQSKGWSNSFREEKTAIFGKDAIPFSGALLKHGAHEGDIVMLDLNHGSTPPIHRKTEAGANMLYEKGTIRLYTPEGELKARIKFDHSKDKIHMKKYSPAGRWFGKEVDPKM
jgi:hypothetical protein